MPARPKVSRRRDRPSEHSLTKYLPQHDIFANITPMKLATAPDKTGLVPAIKRHMHETPFMVIVQNPGDINLMLFAGTTSCDATYMQAKVMHPFCFKVQDVEYLSPTTLDVLRRQSQDPLTRTLRDLGLQKDTNT